MIREINVRDRGQMTLPADIRNELGMEHGGILILIKRDNEIVLKRREDIKDPAAGLLAQYARKRNPDPAEERRLVARYIGRNADSDS